MGTARASTLIDLTPAEALERFADVNRWEAFVDGFARLVEVSASWPAPGSQVAWESTPSGRGHVMERIEAYEAAPPAPDLAPQSSPSRLVTEVEDQSLNGTQSATFSPEEQGARLDLELDYQLIQGGALSGLTDLLFIRRAVRDSLRRTVERFEREAAAANRAEPGEGEPAG